MRSHLAANLDEFHADSLLIRKHLLAYNYCSLIYVILGFFAKVLQQSLFEQFHVQL